jgi:hypothetical protein
MPKDEYDDDDDEMSLEEEGFLAGYKQAQKRKGLAKEPEFIESDEFEDERLTDE